ncbi:MAG TPA: hypothetical protein IAC62_12045 [Candidatus Pelethocola excrementipullorum]|nr:hypothetical protein [Candidatus Pelethocola excrementipullorum]
MAYESYVPVVGIIQSISDMDGDCCTQKVTLQTNSGIVNFIVSPDTVIVECIRLSRGMRVAAFYDSSLPVPLIYPPQYQAQMMTTLGWNQSIMLNYFDEDLLATDNSLKINLGDTTYVTTLNGQPYYCNPGGHALLVYYTNTTRSIPPQTTPEEIVVLCK